MLGCNKFEEAFGRVGHLYCHSLWTGELVSYAFRVWTQEHLGGLAVETGQWQCSTNEGYCRCLRFSAMAPGLVPKTGSNIPVSWLLCNPFVETVGLEEEHEPVTDMEWPLF